MLPPITIIELNHANSICSNQEKYKMLKKVIHCCAERKLVKIEEENKRILEHSLMNYEVVLAFDMEEEDFIQALLKIRQKRKKQKKDTTKNGKSLKSKRKFNGFIYYRSLDHKLKTSKKCF